MKTGMTKETKVKITEIVKSLYLTTKKENFDWTHGAVKNHAEGIGIKIAIISIIRYEDWIKRRYTEVKSYYKRKEKEAEEVMRPLQGMPAPARSGFHFRDAKIELWIDGATTPLVFRLEKETDGGLSRPLFLQDGDKCIVQFGKRKGLDINDTSALMTNFGSWSNVFSWCNNMLCSENIKKRKKDQTLETDIHILEWLRQFADAERAKLLKNMTSANG